MLKLALFSLSISIRFYGEKISLTPGLENFYFLMYAHIIHMTSMRVCVCVCVSHSVISNSLQPLGLSRTRLHHPWNSPGKNTGVGCLSLLQGIFLTQGLNRGLLHCRQILYRLSHQGSPIIHILFINSVIYSTTIY